MITNVISKKELNHLVQFSKRYFLSVNWSFEAFQKKEDEYLAKKGSFRIHLQFIRENVVAFYSPSSIMDDLARRARTSAIWGFAVCFVTSRHFPEINLDLAAKQGILIFHLDELELISRSTILRQQNPNDLDQRTLQIIASNPEFCVSLARSLSHSKGEDLSLDWLYLAVRRHRQVTVAHIYLFNRLKQSGNLEKAMQLAQTALDFDPNNIHFLKEMHRISAEQNNAPDAEVLRKRISTAQAKKSDHAKIFAGIQSAQSAGMSELTHQPAKIVPTSTGLSSFLNKLRFWTKL